MLLFFGCLFLLIGISGFILMKINHKNKSISISIMPKIEEVDGRFHITHTDGTDKWCNTKQEARDFCDMKAIECLDKIKAALTNLQDDKK